MCDQLRAHRLFRVRPQVCESVYYKNVSMEKYIDTQQHNVKQKENTYFYFYIKLRRKF